MRGPCQIFYVNIQKFDVGAAADPFVRRWASLPHEVCGETLCQALQDISKMIIMNSSKFKPGLPSSFHKLNFPNDQLRFAVDGTDNFSQTNQEYTLSHPTQIWFLCIFILATSLTLGGDAGGMLNRL